MKILHVSAECYPAAKSGGLGDVVGALPKYLTESGMESGVVIPKYRLKWLNERPFMPVFRGAVRLHNQYYAFTVEREQGDSLGFPFFAIDIPGKFDRPGIYADPGGYGYDDEIERYLSFQQAVLQWIVQSPGKPQVIHCHDHHTGLIPFMTKYCPEYDSLAGIPTMFTIHNGAYHGSFRWQNMYLLPFFRAEARGLLDWSDVINPLATGIKCATRVTTVSPSYLYELMQDSNGLEWLIQHEIHKCAGIINGIDAAVWDPRTDHYIATHLEKDAAAFKKSNKAILNQRFRLDLNLPLITFIGRLVGEKGADLLPDLISRVLNSGMQVAFAILGTGQPNLHEVFRQMTYRYPGKFDAILEYNEGLAHQLYAGSDYLIMPSRIEPCGLNQMYAMRYGTLPIVRSVGGLRDTVPDIGEPDGSGRGIRFDHFNLDDGFMAVYRAAEFFYNHKKNFETVRERIMKVDFSWERSAREYMNLYQEMTEAQ